MQAKENHKPASVLVHRATGRVWLMGFGVPSRLPRERQSPEPLEVFAGTLACMTEQTGRMDRSIDSRSFPLGQHDTSDRLLIPEKLYGRAHEVETLLRSL